MTLVPSTPPTSLVDAVRGRVAPLFPEWTDARIDELVGEMAAIEWRYLIRSHGMPLPMPRDTPIS